MIKDIISFRSMALIVMFTMAVPAVGDDWPQWRGLNRDAKSQETDLLEQWPEDGPTQRPDRRFVR